MVAQPHGPQGTVRSSGIEKELALEPKAI